MEMPLGMPRASGIRPVSRSTGTCRIQVCCQGFAPQRPSLEPVAALVSGHTRHPWGSAGGSPCWLAVPRRILGSFLEKLLQRLAGLCTCVETPRLGRGSWCSPHTHFGHAALNREGPWLWMMSRSRPRLQLGLLFWEPVSRSVGGHFPGKGQLLLKGASLPSPSWRFPSPCPSHPAQSQNFTGGSGSILVGGQHTLATELGQGSGEVPGRLQPRESAGLEPAAPGQQTPPHSPASSGRGGLGPAPLREMGWSTRAGNGSHWAGNSEGATGLVTPEV